MFLKCYNNCSVMKFYLVICIIFTWMKIYMLVEFSIHHLRASVLYVQLLGFQFVVKFALVLSANVLYVHWCNGVYSIDA